MARNSSRTGVAIAALWVIVCASPSAPAQEWVRWQGTPSLLDQDPAKRLPAQTAPKTEGERPAAPATETATTSAPAAAAPAPSAVPSPGGASPSPPVATAALSPPAPPVLPVANVPVSAAPAAPAPKPAPVAVASAPMAEPVPKRGSPAITVPALSAADSDAVEIAPLSPDDAPIAQRLASVDAPPAASPALVRADPAASAPRGTGAYVTVGSDSDASLVAAAPQVYSCDDDGRCDQLQDEHAGVGLDTAVQAQVPPQQQIESQIKRNALRSF
ncbi:hypothetical protein LVB77_12480 [Lysobacter sp. 5GHs7-4]|uniref:hypothetical protein n=1 Tax=Lysobacter sp. 5GHs7-4 TaxID=2904253 RepID=UPI001E327419|nr:hypothetical protein [Lysobacter sp. 5GHs7-4]UHQ21500.1 hypothetical protein LVB77_12480 [Lysobacter sp. 5GHs7-4]